MFHLITGVGQLVLRGSLIGGVTRDLGKTAQLTAIVLEAHEDAVCPKPGAILAHMKTAIQGPAFNEGSVHFFLDLALPSIFSCKNHCARLPDRFVLAPSKYPFRSRAPKRDRVFSIEQKHRVISRALDKQPKTLFAFAQCFLGPFAVCYIVEAIDRAENLARFVLDRPRCDQNIAASAILLLDQNFKIPRLQFFTAKHPGHRTVLVWHGPAIRIENLK